MVLVANHVICTDFNYSYFLSCLSNASVNWLLQSYGKVPSPDPFTYFYSVLPPQHLLLLGVKDVLPRTFYWESNLTFLAHGLLKFIPGFLSFLLCEGLLRVHSFAKLLSSFLWLEGFYFDSCTSEWTFCNRDFWAALSYLCHKYLNGRQTSCTCPNVWLHQIWLG